MLTSTHPLKIPVKKQCLTCFSGLFNGRYLFPPSLATAYPIFRGTLVVDEQMELEAKEPPHSGGTTPGQTPEDPVTVDAPIVADRQPGAVGTLSATWAPWKAGLPSDALLVVARTADGRFGPSSSAPWR